jgi:predicted dehydrogenase
VTAPLRVGIVGVGWGALVHGPAYQLVDGYELVALCGRRPEPLARAAERLGVMDTSSDWESFVRRDDLDLISIVLPVQLHQRVFLAALGAGKHVLCEKPLCLTGSEGREMVTAAEASNRETAVCFENRWSPERLAIWEHVAAGELGQLYYAQVSQSAGYWHPSRPLQSTWMYRLDEGGGYLNGMASHDIDFLQTLFGPVAEVCADVRTSVPSRPLPDGGALAVDADDTSALVLRMASGSLAVITTSVVGRNADSQAFLALGSEGTIEISRAGGQGSALWTAPGAAEPVVLGPSVRQLKSGRALPERRSSAAIRAQAFMLEDWLPAFSGQPTPVPTVRDAWLVQEVIDAARRSSAGEGWVPIPQRDASERPS